ncbi:MAG: urea ABC transporter permease subunit UrtB [Sneathiella sp.]|nr:MAG: urea ABC transporter permease subunit UrtB [Sneathiella sp.]
MRIILKSFLAALAILFMTQAVAVSADLTEASQGLLAKGYKDKTAAVEAVAATGDARSVIILEALLGGKLFIQKSDNVLVIGVKAEGGYKTVNAITGTEIGLTPKSDVKKVRINNKMRGLIKGQLGGLTLLSDDPALRMKAANAVFISRPKEMMAPMQSALASETDPTVVPAMTRALAALELRHGATMADKQAALEILSDLHDPQVKSLLSGELSSLRALQNPTGPEKELIIAVQAGLTKIDEKLDFLNIIENIFQGISLGSVLLLAAIGLAITFGVMGVINMAHGEMVMIGAYTTYVVQELCRNFAPGFLDYALIAAVPLAFIVSGLCGVGIERSVIRYLYGRPLETLLATWGISLILQQFVRTIFGPTNKEVSSPEWLSGTWEVTGGLALTYNRIAIILFAAAVLLMLVLILKKTAFGLQMRAVTQNRQMAASMGIRTGWVDAMTFGLGSGVAGMAGVALSQIDNVSPNLGQAYIIDSFMVVVFGGVGNLWGTLVGALSLGITNKFLEPYTGAVLAKILVLVAIILFIQKRPRGLFALKGRAVES